MEGLAEHWKVVLRSRAVEKARQQPLQPYGPGRVDLVFQVRNHTEAGNPDPPLQEPCTQSPARGSQVKKYTGPIDILTKKVGGRI